MRTLTEEEKKNSRIKHNKRRTSGRRREEKTGKSLEKTWEKRRREAVTKEGRV